MRLGRQRNVPELSRQFLTPLFFLKKISPCFVLYSLFFIVIIKISVFLLILLKFFKNSIHKRLNIRCSRCWTSRSHSSSVQFQPICGLLDIKLLLRGNLQPPHTIIFVIYNGSFWLERPSPPICHIFTELSNRHMLMPSWSSPFFSDKHAF